MAPMSFPRLVFRRRQNFALVMVADRLLVACSLGTRRPLSLRSS
jgi:hypothetical protein